MRAVPFLSLARTFARSFLIQGSWNYRSMLGCGFAFAMMPSLRAIYRDDPHALRRALDRHLDHFNAHPYLSGVALGAAIRLEAEGADDEAIRRFKVAVRGPLGGLGDTLVWALWLPAASLVALVAFWLGAPGWLAAVSFLIVYNVVHVGLRAWGFRAGLAAGRGVGAKLAQADLAGLTGRLKPGAVVVLGALTGVLLTADGGLAGAGPGWMLAGVGAIGLGLGFGHRSWRPAAAVTVAVTLILGVWGMLT